MQHDPVPPKNPIAYPARYPASVWSAKESGRGIRGAGIFPFGRNSWYGSERPGGECYPANDWMEPMERASSKKAAREGRRFPGIGSMEGSNRRGTPAFPPFAPGVPACSFRGMMSRIRSVKPDIWVSTQFVELSLRARLLFIGLFNFSDDNGIHPADPRKLKMEIFPGDDCTWTEVGAWIDELINVGLLAEFDVDGARYWLLTGWKTHQKIDRPTDKYPTPESPGAIMLDSGSDHRAITERSPPEGKGGEGKGGEGKGREGNGMDGKGGEDHTEPLAPGEGGNDLEIIEGPKPPQDTAPAFQWLSWEFHEARKKLGDEYFDPWDPKYLKICKIIVEKKARGNYDEAKRRALNLVFWSRIEPNFYRITPMDLSNKWADLNSGPNMDTGQMASFKDQVFKKRADEIREEIANGKTG